MSLHAVQAASTLILTSHSQETASLQVTTTLLQCFFPLPHSILQLFLLTSPRYKGNLHTSSPIAPPSGHALRNRTHHHDKKERAQCRTLVYPPPHFAPTYPWTFICPFYGTSTHIQLLICEGLKLITLHWFTSKWKIQKTSSSNCLGIYFLSCCMGYTYWSKIPFTDFLMFIQINIYSLQIVGIPTKSFDDVPTL